MAIPPVEIHPHLITFGAILVKFKDSEEIVNNKNRRETGIIYVTVWVNSNGPLWPKLIRVEGQVEVDQSCLAIYPNVALQSRGISVPDLNLVCRVHHPGHQQMFNCYSYHLGLSYHILMSTSNQ